MSLVLDAGAFLAVERRNREVLALLRREHGKGRPPATHGGVVGQVWRGGPRQVLLARLLPAVVVHALDETLGKRAGVLCARAKTADVVDAALVLCATDGDIVLTSDPADLARLAAAAELHVDIVQI